ncbi:MAG TPA: hypothetical protein VLB85_13235 [Acidimicrobiia bacterium]|nr:hypothetical protein [Acidimicrobiia bacterium]
MRTLNPGARNLFRAALLIFVVTIVIGILNGMDLWSPSHEMLLTHVHAGTLGWITLAVVGTAFLMFEDGGDDQAATLAMATIGAVVLYVIAFATGTGIFRPIAGTLMLIAIVWALVWVWGRYNRSAKATPQLGVLLAMVSLAIGAVLGVLLGLFIANGSLPGLSTETAQALAGAHPPAMLIGYLILAGAAVADWLLGGKPGTLGRVVVWLLFAGGIIANIALIFDLEALIQVFSLLQVVAIVLFVIRMWEHVTPGAWSGSDASGTFARLAVVFLLVGIGLLVYVVQLFVSGELNPETGEGPIGVLLAFDHSMFIGVMTNAIFGVIARSVGKGSDPVVIWAINGGLALFLVGLVADVTILKQIGAPLMGLALLYGIYVYLRELSTPSVPQAA